MGKGSHKGRYLETYRSNGFGSHDIFCKSCIEDKLIKRSNIDYHKEALFFRFDIPATLSLNKSFKDSFILYSQILISIFIMSVCFFQYSSCRLHSVHLLPFSHKTS